VSPSALLSSILRALDFRMPNDIMKIDIGKIDAKEDVEDAVTYECLLNVTTSISSLPEGNLHTPKSGIGFR